MPRIVPMTMTVYHIIMALHGRVRNYSRAVDVKRTVARGKNQNIIIIIMCSRRGFRVKKFDSCNEGPTAGDARDCKYNILMIYLPIYIL